MDFIDLELQGHAKNQGKMKFSKKVQKHSFVEMVVSELRMHADNR